MCGFHFVQVSYTANRLREKFCRFQGSIGKCPVKHYFSHVSFLMAHHGPGLSVQILKTLQQAFLILFYLHFMCSITGIQRSCLKYNNNCLFQTVPSSGSSLQKVFIGVSRAYKTCHYFVKVCEHMYSLLERQLNHRTVKIFKRIGARMICNIQ